MSFIKYKIKMLEGFKDGTVLEGRELRANEVLTVDEMTKLRIVQSGGLIEVLQSVIPNPKKDVPVEAEPEVVSEKKNARKS